VEPRAQFAVSADGYDRFMGRYSEPLAPLFADFAGVEAGTRVLDVGCGPGALTTELARRLGATGVSAIDPAEHFVERCRARVPEADVQRAAAEELPFENGTFDTALSQLVVSFMRDADTGVTEMRRVVRPGGAVAACMWADGEMEILGVFWGAASTVDSAGRDADLRMRYRKREELEGLLERAGLEEIRAERLSVESEYEGFDAFWEALRTAAAGPIGAFYAKLDDDQRARLRDECRSRLGNPQGSFTLTAAAWAVCGRAGDAA